MGQKPSSTHFTGTLKTGDEFAQTFIIDNALLQQQSHSYITIHNITAHIAAFTPLIPYNKIFVHIKITNMEENENKSIWDYYYDNLSSLQHVRVSFDNDLPENVLEKLKNMDKFKLLVRLVGTGEPSFKVEIVSPFYGEHIIAFEGKIDPFLLDADKVKERFKDGDHLIVLVHGIMGSCHDLEVAALRIAEKHPKIHLLATKQLHDDTLSGIEAGGRKVADEIIEVVGNYKGKLSFIGHSLGGLYARYAIGILESNNFFEKIKPVNFVSIATPHSGINKTSFPIYDLAQTLAVSKILSLSGQQLCLADINNGNAPLLSQMAELDSPFFKGLSYFEVRSTYANICNDIPVPVDTASLELPEDNLKEIISLKSSSNTIIIDDTELPTISNETLDNMIPDSVVMKIRKNLRTLTWRRILVEIKLKDAHTLIVVRRAQNECPGEDVLEHVTSSLIQ